jgi:mannosyltransferase
MEVDRYTLAQQPNRIVAVVRRPWIEAAAVAAILFLAIGLRFWHLGSWSFWPDEIFSFGTASDGFSDSILRRSLATDLISAVVGALGPSEWNARLVPALIGMATIPLLYLLLRRCMAMPGALLTVTLLAFSPWHLYWSQNARFYTLLFLFFNLGLLFFYLGLEEDRPWYMVAALLFFGLAARERLVALLGIPAIVAYLLLLVMLRFARPQGLNFRNLAIFFVPALAAGAVLVMPYVMNLEGWMRGFGRINNSPVFLAGGTFFYIGLPVAAFAAGSGLYLVTRKNRLALLLGLSAVLPLAILMALSLIQYTANRYIFFSMFSWLALAGLGFQALWDRLAKDVRVWALIVTGVLLAAYAGDLFQYYTFQNGNRDDWRAAFAHIAENGQPGDIVTSSDYSIFVHYLGAPFEFRPWNEVIDATETGVRQRTWYVEDMTVAEIFPDQLAVMSRHAQPQAEFDVRLPGRTYRMRVYFAEPPHNAETQPDD